MNALSDLIRVNTHSSIRLQLGEKLIYIDPFRLEQSPHDADLILITHEHFDHFSPDDIEKVGRTDTLFILPASMEQTAAAALAGCRLRFVRPGETGCAEGIRFEAIPAYNPDIRNSRAGLAICCRRRDTASISQGTPTPPPRRPPWSVTRPCFPSAEHTQ